MMKTARHVSRISSRALMIIATTCIIAGIYIAKPVVVPLLLAVVITLCLAPAVDGLVRLHVPRAVAAGLVLASMVIVISALLNVTWTPARAWLESAPQTMATIEAKARPIQLLIAKLDRIGQVAHHLTAAYQPQPPSHTQVTVTPEAEQVALSTEAMTAVPTALATAAMIVAFVYLLLAFGPEWTSRLQLSHSARMARSGLILTRAIRVELSRYLASIALINIGVGLAVALLARLFGLPNAMLWGTLAALFNFVPYFGPFCTLTLLTIVGLVNFQTLSPVFMLAGGFLIVTFIEGQFIQPLVLGRRLQLNPMAVLLGMWLLWALWGAAGVVLAVPLLLCVKVLAAHIESLRGLYPLIGALPRRGKRGMPAAAAASAVGSHKLSLAP
jgi:predicted PurR-regulated permease PerM